MLLEHVEITVTGGDEAAFEAALCEVRQRVFMSRGFRGFTVGQDVEDPSRYLVEVLWESAEELAEFAQSRFDRCWAPVQPFLVRRLRVRHFAERPGLALHGPGVISDLAWLAD